MIRAALVLTVLGSTPSQVILGVAEESKLDLDHAPLPQVRLAFRRTSSDWEPFPDPAPTVAAIGGFADLPLELRWTVCFDGKPHGRLETKLVPSHMYARAGVHVPKDGQPIPFPGKRTFQFAGWMNEPVHHPLALTTGGNCSDPGQWHREQAKKAVLRTLLNAMRADVKVKRCDDAGRWLPWRYSDRDVEVVKTYASLDGEWLAMLRVRMPPRPEAEGCDAVLGDEWGTQLFYLSAEGKARHLGAAMSLVDAGDYDRDGRSELLAHFERYNNDGYTLFWGQGFTRQASFGWNYH